MLHVGGDGHVVLAGLGKRLHSGFLHEAFGRTLSKQPEAAGVLRERGAAFGLEERPNLRRVLSSPQPKRVIAGVVAGAEAAMRQELQATAEQEAARQRKPEAERQRRAPRRGYGMSV